MPPPLQKNQCLNIFAYSTATSTIWYHFQAKKKRDGYEKENRGWNKNKNRAQKHHPRRDHDNTESKQTPFPDR